MIGLVTQNDEDSVTTPCYTKSRDLLTAENERSWGKHEKLLSYYE